MTKSAKQILIEARELITPEERWTQGVYAADIDGYVTSPACEYAICWCSIGAIDKVSTRYQDGRYAENILEKVMVESVDTFNDTHTHAEVLAAFDRAIAIA